MRKKIESLIVFCISAVFGAVFVAPVVASALAESTSVSVSITGSTTVSASAPASMTFPSVQTDNVTQTRTVSAGNFVVEDLAGTKNGYYATLSASNLADGAKTISKGNLAVTVPDPTILTLAGTPNSAITVPTDTGEVGAGYKPLSSPILLFSRDTGGGKFGRYGISPTFRIVIPAYTSFWDYTGTITFTLIENPPDCLVGEPVPCMVP